MPGHYGGGTAGVSQSPLWSVPAMPAPAGNSQTKDGKKSSRTLGGCQTKAAVESSAAARQCFDRPPSARPKTELVSDVQRGRGVRTLGGTLLA
jgi:hypothetical protein